MLALNFALTPSENGVVITRLNLALLPQNTKNKMAWLNVTGEQSVNLLIL